MKGQQKMRKHPFFRGLALALVFTLVVTMCPSLAGTNNVYADTNTLTTEQPEIIVTGTGVIGGSAYTADNVGLEKAYTRDELKAMTGGENVLYSSIKSQEPYTKQLTRATGVYVSSLLAGTAADADTDTVSFLANDGYAVKFDPDAEYVNGGSKSGKSIVTTGLNEDRYTYAGLLGGSDADKAASEAMLAWAISNNSAKDPETAGSEKEYCTVAVGQLAFDDQNNPLYNKYMQTVLVGNELEDTALTIGTKEYTRSDVLLMERAERTYNYSSENKGDQTETATGVPMSVLLKDYDETDIVTFDAADGYEVTASGMTVKELIDGNYMLAYEKGGKGIYSTAKNDTSIVGYFTLYGDGYKPSKMVDSITVKAASGIDFSKSPYKHITNGGLEGKSPYNIDAITGATLTVEGPGVKSSVPLPVRDLEDRNAGAFRGDYTDVRDGEETTRTYEGIDLYYILNNMSEGNNGIIMTETAQKVEIKNRNRSTIATFTMEQVNAAHEAGKPIIVSYGTSYTDGTNPRPYVFDRAAGADSALGNEDGCLKLVYDKSIIKGDLNADYTKFANMAYIYVAEESTPGFKHDKAPYDTAENSKYVLTITGDEIGREVNYTVEELEDMVEYDEDGNPVEGGLGHKDEYSLANNSYWYVNEYEGVKLWDLLQKSGIAANKSSDEETIVSFSATDGYAAFDKFSLAQIADPDRFGYYEKNAADNNDGTYESVESDLIDTGYPVLVAYGVNQYPYVIKNTLDGFLSGLSNDGGPLRIISGKTEYSHANGSNQAKLLDKVIVGNDKYHYSTHKYHEKDVYTGLAEEELTVKVVNGSTEDAAVMKEKTYTVGEIEELIYGGKLNSADLKDAKIKGFYEADKDGKLYSDLYEGINLIYFLKNIVELPGEKGTITFTGADGDTYTAVLDDFLKLTDGYNTATTLSGLSPVLAFAKNGAPMVNSKDAADGYEKEVTLGEGEYATEFTIKNNGGPLCALVPNTSKTAGDAKAITSITDITINLSPDNYAHIEAPYDTYATETLTVSGEGIRPTEAQTLTVSELEGKQVIAETAVYSILKDGVTEASQTRFRGINVYKLLQQIGLKSNADKVIFTCGDNSTMEFSLSEVRNPYKNTVTGDDDLSMILAYGSADGANPDPEDGKPLVDGKDAASGYDAAYGNNGGPLKLVVGQTDEADTNSKRILKDVVAIEVTASETVSWNHSSAEVYKQYLDHTLDFVVIDNAGNTLVDKKVTLGEMEGLTDIIEREVIYSTEEHEWEGVNLWGFIQSQTKDIPGMNNIIYVNASQGSYTQDIYGKFGQDQFVNGIKDGESRVPIVLAYAMDGYPLVPGSSKTGTPNGEGYVDLAENNGGPIRLITHRAQGTCIQELERIEVKINATGAVTPTDKFDTDIAGPDGELPFAGVRSISFDKEGGMWVGTYGGGAAYKAPGADTYTVYNEQNGLETGFVSAVAADADGGVWMSQNASYTNPDDNKGVVYMDKDGNMTSYTVEGAPGTLPDNYVQDIKIDKDGNVWFASFGGLTKYNPAADEWTTWTKADSNFPAEAVTKIEFDGNGGVWLGFYPEGTTDGNGGVPFTGGFAHMTADGTVTPYPLTAGFTDSGTSKLAEVWIRDLAVAKDGSVWVVASGAYANIENVGGSVWHVASPGAEAEAYTGDQLFGKALDGAENAELRMVAADNNSGLWFGTSADGVFYVADPTVGEDGTMTVTTMYNTETGSWTDAGMDNVYSLDFYKGAVYAGSTGGLAWLKSDVLKETVGDATAETAQFKITGSGVENNAYFTIKGLKNADGVVKVEKVAYDHMNSSGTTGTTSFDGITMQSLFDLVGLKEGAAKVTVIADDGGYKKEFDITALTKTDKDGNVPILALTQYKDDGTSDKVTTLVIGQDDESHINKSSWVSNICEIIVDVEGTETPDNPGTPDEPDTGDTAGDATAETADISFVGNGLVKEGYFTIKGLKNDEGIEKETKTFAWLNSKGTTGTSEVEGASMKNILKDILGVTDDAEKIIFTSADGMVTEMDFQSMFTKDKDGNRPMLAWKIDGEKCDPTLVIGQADANDVNKSKWAKEIVKVEVTAPIAKENAGDAADEASADIVFTGEGLVKDGYFTIKGLKNAEGIEKDEYTFEWMKSSGTTGQSVVEGASMKNILKDILGVTDDAEKIIFTSADGKVTEMDFQSMFTKDKDGQRPVLAWKVDGEKCDPVLVIGQADDEDVNRSNWIKDIVRVEVTVAGGDAPVEPEVPATDIVKEQIEAIEGLTVTEENLAESKAAVEAARAAYDALTEAEKAELGSEIEIPLLKAEIAIAATEKAVAEKAAAEAAKKAAEEKAAAEAAAQKAAEEKTAAEAAAQKAAEEKAAAEAAAQKAAEEKAAAEAAAKKAAEEQAAAEASMKTILALTKESVDTVKSTISNLTKNRVNLTYTWNTVDTAEKYRIELFRNGVKVNTAYRVKEKVKFTYYKRGYEYTVKVTPYIFDGDNYYYGDAVTKTVTSKHGAATLSVVKKGNYRVIKSADRNSTGFQVYIAKNNKFNKNVKKVKFVTNGKALNKKVLAKKYFKKGVNYVKVRAYTTYNGKTVYGNWSTVKKVKR